MITLTKHTVEGEPNPLTIVVLDNAGQGNAHHEYDIGTEKDGSLAEINFQNGPIKEEGVNGVTIEALIAICIHRLECFQTSAFASEDNARALTHLEVALGSLQNRTRARIARGVEGTNNV